MSFASLHTVIIIIIIAAVLVDVDVVAVVVVAVASFLQSLSTEFPKIIYINKYIYTKLIATANDCW